MHQEYLVVMSVAPTGATTSASGPGESHWIVVSTSYSHSVEGPSTSQGNASTLTSNATLSWCYVNGPDSTNSTSSPPGVPRPGVSLTNASPPSASFGQTNATNATTILSNSTAFCAQLLTATPSPSLTPTGGSLLRVNRRALDISETTNSSIVSTTSSLHPISSSSSGESGSSSTHVSTPVPTTTSSQPSPGASSSTNAVSPVSSVASSSASFTVSQSSSSMAPSTPASVTESSTSLGISGSSQSTPTVTETPESTSSTPVSTTDNNETITMPPFVATTGLSTLPGATVTHVSANPPNQVVSSSSRGDS
jgi:hypothetical protein